MSKHNSRISGSPLRLIATALIVSSMSLFSESSSAQDKGFSIFESAKTSSEVPVVAPREAFTNPLVKLPKTQFGTFGNEKTSTVSSKPQLSGSKAEGTYAYDGRNMFSKPPTVKAKQSSGNLQPYTPNSLRAENRIKLDSGTEIQSKPAPVVGDFQKSARPLSPTVTGKAQSKTTAPKIGQVAFQDNAFPPSNRAQSNSTANRFNQSTGNRFGGGAPASSSSSFPPVQRTALGQPQPRTRMGQAAGTQPLQQSTRHSFAPQNQRAGMLRKCSSFLVLC